MNQLTLNLIHVYSGDVSAARTLAKISNRMEEKDIKFKIINCNVRSFTIGFHAGGI
jgi:hypothetical protein